MWLPPKPSHNVLSGLSPRDREVRTTFRFKSNQLLIASGRKIACLRDNSAQHSYRKTAGCTFSLKDSTPTRVGVENYLERDLDVFGRFRPFSNDMGYDMGVSSAIFRFYQGLGNQGNMKTGIMLESFVRKCLLILILWFMKATRTSFHRPSNAPLLFCFPIWVTGCQQAWTGSTFYKRR